MNDTDLLSPITSTNLSDIVYDKLRQIILKQVWSPGHRLDLTMLEKQLQVSRTPLRIALKRLEADGLIDIHPRRGTFVASIERGLLEEKYKIRSSFELYVALCLFKYLEADHYQHIERIHHKMNQLVDECDEDWQSIIEPYLKLDYEFHHLLVRIGGPTSMLEIFEQLAVHFHIKSIVPNYSNRDFIAMHFEHEQIFASITDQSPERLNATLLNHLESARHRIMKITTP